MKKVLTVAAVICSVLSGVAQSVYFVKFKDSVPVQSVNFAVKQNAILFRAEIPGKDMITSLSFLENDDLLRDTRVGRIVKISLSRSTPFSEFAANLQNPEQIEYIEANKTFRMDFIPNDSLFNRQWALEKINARQAWDITKGQDSIRIAIIDTGIDFFHPDIANKIFINSGETGTDSLGRDKRSNGIDDDNNGFIDDYMGWDFTDRTGFPYDSTGGDYLNWDNYPMDQNIFSHGTAVAGIIAAETNNGKGIAGVAPNIKVMNLRAFDPDGFGEEDDVASAILYAVKMNAKVINMSFGDNSFSYVLRDVIQFAYGKNVTLVASSGNSSSSAPHYPSGYSEVISVGNSTPEDYVASGSNYGSTLDLVAPGTVIMSLAKNYAYSEFSGTSAAAPHVSALAGLILSRGAFTNEEVKQILKSTCDDIGAPGWDERSGAGRINAARALLVLAPALVKFDHPGQDFATSADTLKIQASVLSPYFSSFSLYVGTGLNPSSWTAIIPNQTSQTAHTLLNTLNLSQYNDTSITIRLVLKQTDGRTIEERVNFHIIRKAPVGEAIVFPAYYGNTPTLSASVIADQHTTVRMFFRKKNAANFTFVSLDGFTLNNFFVKKAHYGFIPRGLAEPETEYEIYFELENLVGKKTVIKNTSGNYFLVRTPLSISNKAVLELDYSLPQGLIFHKALSITSAGNDDILYNKSSDVSKTYIYTLNNGTFVMKDSLLQRIPKDAGDFNNDRKVDILSNWGRNAYISTQTQAAGTTFSDVYKNENGSTWPAIVRDIDSDGLQEALFFTSDSTFAIYQIQNGWNLVYKTSAKNFSSKGYGGNVFDYPSAQVLDLDGDGKNEIWICDTDGDVLCYNVISASQLVPDTLKSFSTGFVSSSSHLQTGDFNGDGKPDLGIILQSVENVDVAKFNLVYVLGYINNADTILFAQAFIDPATEFNVFTRKTYNTLKLSRASSAVKDDLILAMFPYSYIYSYENGEGKPIFFRDVVNANAIFTGDLNHDGTNEFGLSFTDKVRFFQFYNGTLPPSPEIIYAASVSHRALQLNWRSGGPMNFIYRGTTANTMALVDSTSYAKYVDTNVTIGMRYHYSVRSKNSAGILSLFSASSSVLHHIPARLISVAVVGRRSVECRYSDQINTSVVSLQSWFVRDSNALVTLPETCSPSGQYSFMVTFPKNLLKGTYTFVCTGLTDAFGSTIEKDSSMLTFIDAVPENILFVESFNLLSNYELAVTFNLPLDSVSAVNKQNYIFDPSNNIGKLSYSGGTSRTVMLSIADGRPVGSVGHESVLHIKNLRSSVGTGGILINSGAGSFIVISNYAKDLSDVYVYPNPARESDGAAAVTFANLPRYAEIIIFNINGNKLQVLAEKDGNGGVTWDLRDDKGDKLSSGIYFGLIRQMNDRNEESETKLIKFSIVK